MLDLANARADQARHEQRDAAAIAAAIPIPIRLPARLDGQPLTHLSASSYSKWLACPEAWRRHYILGERAAPSGAMFLGSRVDDTLCLYYQQLIDTGETLTPTQLQDHYRDRWSAQIAYEHDRHGISWNDALPEQAAFNLGLRALETALNRIVPHLGHPLAVQRKLELTLAPGLEWTVQCFLDLETTSSEGEPVQRVVDFKVKDVLISAEQARSDIQASIYLAARWLEGQPATEFLFAQIAKPCPRRQQIGHTIVPTARSTGQLRGTLARLALAASQINACHHTYGPDRPWGFADPGNWRCSPRYCPHWTTCPGGRGL